MQIIVFGVFSYARHVTILELLCLGLAVQESFPVAWK